MNVISKSFYTTWKFYWIRNQVAFFIPLFHRPAIVDYYVFITGIFITVFYKCIGNGLDEIFINVRIESVPAVPSHRRSWCQVRKFLGGGHHRKKKQQYEQRFFHFYNI